VAEFGALCFGRDVRLYRERAFQQDEA